MNADALAARIDHTVLGPETTIADVRRVLDEARDYGMNACVPPCFVADAIDYAPDVSLVTVVGFPHGQHAMGAKRDEAVRAWKDGADELDVVLNRGFLRAGEDDRIRAELEEIVAAVPIPVKVILETGALDDAQIDRACELAVEADAAFLKTSTGFGGGGATVEAVERLATYLPVKASGGIGDYETATAMLEAGAERIGASSGVAIVEGWKANAP